MKDSTAEKKGTPGKNTGPIKHEEEIQTNPDNKIDEDFRGFPHGHSGKGSITPKNEKDKKTAAVNVKDGEKMDKDDEINEQQSDGSGGAFEGTETVQDDQVK